MPGLWRAAARSGTRASRSSTATAIGRSTASSRWEAAVPIDERCNTWDARNRCSQKRRSRVQALHTATIASGPPDRRTTARIARSNSALFRIPSPSLANKSGHYPRPGAECTQAGLRIGHGIPAGVALRVAADGAVAVLGEAVPRFEHRIGRVELHEPRPVVTSRLGRRGRLASRDPQWPRHHHPLRMSHVVGDGLPEPLEVELLDELGQGQLPRLLRRVVTSPLGPSRPLSPGLRRSRSARLGCPRG